MARGNTLSLTVMVIILAMLGLFVGYLLGNWFIQLVTGEAPSTHQVVENRVVEEEIILKDEETEPSTYFDEQEEDETQEQLKGDVFVVQVGAFSSYNNALSLKEQLAGEGFEAVITEGVPYKVQLGATIDRSGAEETKRKIESLGYEAFITH
jgi:cell division protein FtsN